MCFGGGPVGPQKYSGGSSKAGGGGDNNTAHEEMMSKAQASSAARKQPSQSDRPRMRGGAAPRASLLTRTIDSIFPKG